MEPISDSSPIPVNIGSKHGARKFPAGKQQDSTIEVLSYIASIDRRVQIADPETGLVFGLSVFHRPLLERTLRVAGVPDVETITLDGMRPSDWAWAHVFKIRDGKLRESEAMGGIDLPLNSKSGWE